MKINSLYDARHFSARLRLGVDYTYTSTLISKDIAALAVAQANVPVKIQEMPDITVWEEIQALPTETKEQKQVRTRLLGKDANTLVAWWLKQLHLTPHPQRERMVLFWHNHFTSELRKLRQPQLLYRQNQLFRKHAFGDFSKLLHAIHKDPAMLLYLDGNKSKAAQPNENFARELLELFTLGEGHYTEQDIIQAARAFTGWRFLPKENEVVFQKKLHDTGKKTFLGKTGNFGAADIINILLDTPRTADFIAEKFWHEFINPGIPHKGIIAEWGQTFRESGYQISALLARVIQSDVFWAQENRATLIKSPVEFTIGLLRELQLDEFSAYPKLARINKQLGQELFSPPDVKGWRGGNTWLDNTTLVLRHDFIDNIATEYEEKLLQPTSLVSKLNQSRELAEWLLPYFPSKQGIAKQTTDEQFLALLKDPVYQLR
ncbi:Protein of unknown function [Thiothrix caldifontis]|uniref:DUF1800 domain-containing protein n=1 Tax=Thiothrix caldifontis TaxID=525918 RepID=A0A1H4DNW9_9GAMM|nr:DUF1800 domain-containing protein [Thiothrix caldifontis]SEA73902.1 Protein of unknown function [Thiothrix caldifontis]